jgi:hypothetical protein
MKLRFTFLLLTGAMLLGATQVKAAAAASGAALPFCVADLNAPELPSATPSSSRQGFLGIPCGVCSQSICQGKKLASVCGIGGGGVYLLCADVGICTQDGSTNCSCKSGPPL